MAHQQIDWAIAIANFVSAASKALDGLYTILEPVARNVLAWTVAEKFRADLGAAGWLPNHTTPFQIVADCGRDVEAIRTRLNDYYELNWSDVRLAIESQMNGYDIDREAKEIFIDALDAHGHGLYRCVPRTLFPEIDRLIRIHVLGAKTGQGLRPATIKKLVDDQNKGLSDFLPGGFLHFDYFGRLTKGVARESKPGRGNEAFGLFQYVNEEDLELLESDPIPNRHAVIHGYVSYQSAQNSLNSIFICDYFFHLFSSLESNPRPRMIMTASIDLQPFRNRLVHLEAALSERTADLANPFVRDAVVLRFTFAFDAVVSALRQYLLDAAPTDGFKRKSTHQCFREAADLGLVTDGSAWMLHADHRNKFDKASNTGAIAANAASFAADARALLNAMERGIADGG